MKSRNWSRRDFLKTASAATLAAPGGGISAHAAADGPATAPDQHDLKPTADTVIVLWMAGGMAHTETFDPKRYTPFEKGLESNEVFSARSRRSTPPSTTSSLSRGWRTSRR